MSSSEVTYPSKLLCCMCNENIGINGTKELKSFIPSECLQKWGSIRAHKICEVCWWEKFALENSCHKCPGCLNVYPLNK
jgi:hypothetical protein